MSVGDFEILFQTGHATSVEDVDEAAFILTFFVRKVLFLTSCRFSPAPGVLDFYSYEFFMFKNLALETYSFALAQTVKKLKHTLS